ncbi:MAG: hypothetical protein WA021_01755 [Minisyncoccia bacterium]
MRFVVPIVLGLVFMFAVYLTLTRFLVQAPVPPLPAPILPSAPVPPITATTTQASATSTPLSPTPTASTTPLKPSPVMDVIPRKRVMTTYFWVGEKAGPENDYITNTESYFDGAWMKSFGGEDDPEDRCGFLPCGFTPKENPFYFALPYADLDHDGVRKISAMRIPWFNAATAKDGVSVLKNRWIEIKYGQKTCYAQWADIGPFGEEDFGYVFGTATPRNKENNSAGLDVSPAVWTCLNMPTNDYTEWRFVEEKEVPAGPWKEIVTRD